MSKEIELLKSALEIVIKNPDLTVEVTFKTKVFHINEAPKKKALEKKTEKKDEPEIKKESVKPKAGSGTVDEFDDTLSSKSAEEKKSETKIKPEVENTGEKKIIPEKKDLEDVEAATEENTSPDKLAKVKLPEGGKHCAACQGTGVGSKGPKCVPCKGTGIEQKINAPFEPNSKIDKKAGGDGDWDF